MYLSRGLIRDGVEHAMVGALPFVVEHTARPQGHGYVAATIDAANPFLAVGSHVVGHEFHYSRLVGPSDVETVLAVERGVGLGHGRDGARAGNVIATYTHLHALGAPEWASSLVQAARGVPAHLPERAVAASTGGTR